MIIYFIILLLLVGFNFVPKFKHKLGLINYGSLFILFLILVLNTDNPDYKTYKFIFNSNDSIGLTEIGFKTLVAALKGIGFENYRVIQVMLGLLIVFTITRVYKRTNNFHFIVLLYFLFPFIMDIIQIRNSFMYLFIINALIDYGENNKKRFVLFGLLALSFHYHAIVYLFIFLLLSLYKRYKDSRKDLVSDKWFYILISVGSFINILLGSQVIDLIELLIPSDFIKHKLSLYLVEYLNYDSLVVWGLVLIMDVLVFYKILKNKEHLIINSKHENLIRTLFLFLVSGIFYLGFLLYVYEFNRFFRALFLIKYILYCLVDNFLTQKERYMVRTYLIVISLGFAFIYYTFGIQYGYILKENLLIKLFN